MVAPIAVLGCASRGSAPARAQIRDSAGIRVIDNPAPLARDGIAFRVDAAPAMEIGGTGEAHAEFGRVSGSARLGNGAIAVADGGNNELRFFDSTGAWRRTAGRKGGGPGEFDQLGGLFRLGPDSVAVFDINHRRVSVFGADGSLIREMTLPQGSEEGFSFAIGVLGHGLLVQTQRFSHTTEKSGPRRDSVPVSVYPRWTAPAKPLGTFPGSELYSNVESSGGRIRSVMTTIMPFGKALTLSTAGGRLDVGTGDRPEIASYDSAGRLRRLIRWSQPSDPVTAADIAAIKRRRLEGFRPGAEAMRDKVKGTLEAIAYPATKPAYEGFVSGTDGRLWVLRYDQPATDRAVRYEVFDPNGQWLGHVTLPPAFALQEAGEGYALGVWKDADDVEFVRLYKLHPIQ
jgi:hypothetical protein